MTRQLRPAALAVLFVLGLGLGLGLSPALSPTPAAAAPARPAQLVAVLNETLLEVMRKASELGYRGRYDRLSPVLRETFNFRVMAGISAGKHWRALSPEQRRTLVESFSRSSIGTFAARFDGFGGERFEVIGEEPGPRGSILVRNRLVKSDGEAIEINYLMKRYDERWRVIDVYLDSTFSELATKRAEYTSVLGREGFADLIRRIEEKLATLAREG